MKIGTHLFVKVPRPRDSEGTFFGLRVCNVCWSV